MAALYSCCNHKGWSWEWVTGDEVFFEQSSTGLTLLALSNLKFYATLTACESQTTLASFNII